MVATLKVPPATATDSKQTSALPHERNMDRTGSFGDTEVVRMRISTGGRFDQKPDGSYKYTGGQNFIDQVPVTWRYTDLMFSLSEKVNGAVSVKYQLPGDDTDPDTLISVADDNDITNLFDEYFSHFRKTTTPVKTYRLQVYLFRAAEDAYTPEDLVAEARYMSGTVPMSGASSLMQSLRCAETDPESDAMSAGIKSELGDDQEIEEAAFAWEAGFQAGQEAAVLASDDEWKTILNSRMARLAKVASSYMLGDGFDGRKSWSDFSGGGRVSPALQLNQSVDSAAAVAAEMSGSGMLVARGSASRLAAMGGGGNGNGGSTTSTVREPRDRDTSPDIAYAPSEQPDADPNFRSMFESKYEVDSISTSKPPSPGPSGNNNNNNNKPPTVMSPKTARQMLSPSSLLPNRISVFGDAVTLAEELAAAEAVGSTPPVNLPSHISEFGDDDDEEELARLGRQQQQVDFDRQASGGVNGVGGARQQQLDPMSVLRGAVGCLPAVATAANIPLPPTRPPSYNTGAGDAGFCPQPAASAVLHRSASVEEGLRNVPRMDASKVSVVAKIGEGAFGEVSLCDCPTYGRVAVKWIKPTKAERHWTNFWHEADVMSRLNHPNVLRFFGLVTQKDMVVGIMTEFAAQGSLATLLRSGVGFIPLRRRAQIALHAANGMAYLHSQKVVHFDVKPDNLLLDGDWNSVTGPVVKVADFGLSVVKYNTFCSNVQDLRGTLPYMAPEMIVDHKHVTESADVWSLGVVFWELLTLQVPFADMPPTSLLGALGSNKLRLHIPDWCEPEWRALMEACWVADPVLRPSCKQLASQLERIRDLAPVV